MRILYIESTDERVEKINRLIEGNFPELLTEKNPELILVSGGDGAMLHAIQSFSHLNVPFLGHATGTLNFLMNSIDTKELKRVIREIQENKILFNKINTAKIRVQVSSSASGLIEEVGSAVNEVVIGSSVMGFHSFIINSEDKVFTNFEIKGSGLCISTDLGSTGYNFNLGGDILPLGSELWSLSGIVCDKYLRDILQIGKLEVTCSCRNSFPTVFLDGINKEIALKKGDKVVLKKDGEIELCFLDKEAFLSKRLDIISRYRRA